MVYKPVPPVAGNTVYRDLCMNYVYKNFHLLVVVGTEISD